MEISIIIAVYNASKTIEKCLQSIFKQTFEKYEIIVINDGSTDNTLEIIKKYEKKLKIITTDNCGQGSARNVGIKYATGKYITFVDSDDYIGENRLKEMYDIASFNNSDIVITPFTKINLNKKERVLQNKFSLNIPIPCAITTAAPAPWNKMFSKSLVLKTKFLENVIYEDAYFFYTIATLSTKINFCSNAEYYYVVSDNSTMSRTDRLNDIYEVVKRIDSDTNKFKVEIEYAITAHLIFGHLMRCSSLPKRDIKQKIQETKSFLKNNHPKYYKNKYLRGLKKIAILFFILNLYYFLIVYFGRKNRDLKKW